MAEITFVKTRHVYDSYTDFWRLVELSGFPTIYADELDISKDGVYITAPMNRDWRLHIRNEQRTGKPINAHLISWNIERPDGSAGSVPEYTKQNRYLQYGLWENGKLLSDDNPPEQSQGRFVDEVWVSDRRLADETEHATRFVVLGSDEGLGEPGEGKTFDIVHMSAEVNRRQTIYKRFREDTIGPNCWPPERDDVLKKSRFALNVHQDQHPFQEPLRFALFAAYGLPIISEFIYDPYPWSSEFMIFAAYDTLVRRTNEVLKSSYGQWHEMAKRARERMCHEFQFGKMVRQAVSESVEKWR